MDPLGNLGLQGLGLEQGLQHVDPKLLGQDGRNVAHAFLTNWNKPLSYSLNSWCPP